MLISTASRVLLILGICALPLRADPEEWVNTNLEGLVTLYKHFHSHPELSFMEKETATRLAKEWKEAGVEVTEGVGGFGVVGMIRNGKGPLLMLRADLDALPVTEETGLPYASTVRTKDQEGLEVGVMHACGHDIHIANLVGVGRYLASHKDLWRGTVMLIGQPAEERSGGAKAMLADGLFERFGKPDFALALHVDSSMPVGQVGHRPGYAMANVDSVDITVRGRGGHGAYPHTTVDPIVQAAQLVLGLQTIVSREIKPIEPCVITVGSIHGGTKHNIIPDSCTLQLTVRSYSEEVRKHLLEAIERKANGIAISCGAPAPVVKFSEGLPALYNDDGLANRLQPLFEKSVGKEQFILTEPSMGGEDFGHFGRAGVPILMFRVGSVSQKRLDEFKAAGEMPPSLHSPKYWPDAPGTLAVGVRVMSQAALELLKP